MFIALLYCPSLPCQFLPAFQQNTLQGNTALSKCIGTLQELTASYCRHFPSALDICSPLKPTNTRKQKIQWGERRQFDDSSNIATQQVERLQSQHPLLNCLGCLLQFFSIYLIFQLGHVKLSILQLHPSFPLKISKADVLPTERNRKQTKLV